MKMRLCYAVLISSAMLISGCSKDDKEPLTPLSEAELAEYKELKSEIARRRKKLDEFNVEKKRIQQVEQDYIEQNIKLVEFSLYKTDQFTDGQSRLCYRGEVENNGNEIVSELELSVTLKDSETGNKLSEWNTMLVDANDEFLESSARPEVKAAVVTLAGRRIPIEPNRSYDLGNNKSCMKEVIEGWDESSVDWTISSIELRPKVEAYYSDQVMGPDMLRLLELKKRAEHFDQGQISTAKTE